MTAGWQKQERSTARRLKGTVNSGSGNGWVRKNDVRTRTESWELKTTTKDSYTLKWKDLVAADLNAVMDNRRMVFGIEFSKVGKKYVILNEDDYLEITQDERE